MAVAGSLTYDTKIDGDGLKKGLNSIKGATSASAKAIGAGIAVATTAVAGLVTASVKAYAEYEQLVGGVDTLFKDSSQKVQEYANNAYKTAGLSANQYMETVTGFSASLLQSLGGNTDKASEYANQAVIDMSDNANKMGTSMESIQYAYQGFAKQNYTMLDNLKLGYGGTKEEMQRLLKDAEKISGIKYDISSFADVTQAIHVMQESMGIAGTTAKEANETIEGSIKQVKGAWDNLLVGITNPDADWDTLVQNLVDTVTVAGENILPAVESALVGVSALIRDLFPMIAQQIPALASQILPQLVETGANVINSLITGIQQNLPVLINGAIQIVTTLLTAFFNMLPTILDIGIQIILQLILGIAQQLPTLIPQIINCVLLIVETLLNNIDLLIDAGIQLIIGLAEGLINAIPVIIEKIPVIIEKLIQAIINNLPKIIVMGIRLIVELGAGLIAAIPQLIAMIPQIIGAIINAFVSTDWGAIGRQLLQGLLNGFSNAGNIIWDAIKKVGNSMINGIKSFFGIHSPSRVFANLGQYLPQGFAVGISANTDEAIRAVRAMDSEIMSEMNRAVAVETGSINSKASVQSNNSMLNVIKATFNIDGSIEADGQRFGRIVTPYISKTIKAGGIV